MSPVPMLNGRLTTLGWDYISIQERRANDVGKCLGRMGELSGKDGLLSIGVAN